MRVLILGGGTVGSSIAQMLCSQGHTVTVVDHDPKITSQLDDELDVGVVTGSASQSSVLFQAGAMSADICLAMTGNDEINLVGASIAKAMGTSRVAARIYANVFRDLSTFDYSRHFQIDRFLSIEHLTAVELARRIREPGAMLIEHFAGGELEMQDVLITKSSSSTGIELSELKLPPEVRIGAICRNGNIAIATAQDKIEVGDRITLIGARPKVEEVKKRFHTQSINKQSVVIAGGGETGYHLAQILEARDYNVAIIDTHRDRCDFLASNLQKTTVIFGDARRKLTLEEERIGNYDLFVGCTGDDENNIMACVEAQELGVKTLMAIINRPDYASVVGKLGIDEAVSPYEVMARQVEGLMHNGPLIFRNPHLLAGNIDVVELEVGENALLTKDILMNCVLPKQTLLAAAIRDNSVQVPNAHFQFKPNDTVVALVHTPNIPQLVKVFQ
ncbi:MAG: Trk system potassium transporter TrkA [Planctomycetia bacterium]|nr:Trk system potassium transporter TrkA [Planctomycetia bacterium]